MLNPELRIVHVGEFELVFLLSEGYLMYQCVKIDERVRGLDLGIVQPDLNKEIRVLSVNSPMFIMRRNDALGLFYPTIYLHGKFAQSDKTPYVDYVGPEFTSGKFEGMVHGVEYILQDIVNALDVGAFND